jgi:hypothetical protein
MTNALFGFDNRALGGTFTVSAAVAGLGPDQLADPHGATATSWQTPAGTTSGWVRLDAGAAVGWGAFALCNTNLTPAATLRWRLSDDAAFATAIYDSGTLGGAVVAGYRQAVHVLPSAVTARYLRFDIADPGNPAGFLRAAQLYAGPVVRPARNIGYETAFARAVDAPAITTRGGQEFPILRHTRRSWRIALPSLGEDEVWPLVDALQLAAADGRNVLFLPFPEGQQIARDAVFGRLTDAAPITWPHPTPIRRAWSCTITERL